VRLDSKSRGVVGVKGEGSKKFGLGKNASGRIFLKIYKITLLTLHTIHYLSFLTKMKLCM